MSRDWSDDGYLYHYTSARGLLGIIESQSIWATHSAFLNDERDCLVVSYTLERLSNEGEIHGLGTNPLKHREALRSHLGRGRVTLVASFSQTPNSLAQFKMYCPSSGGYVIGFPREFLMPRGTLIDVDYDAGTHLDWCTDY